MVHNGYLYVSYSTNKEAAQYTRIPINQITLGIDQQLMAHGHQSSVIYNLAGQKVGAGYKGIVIMNGKRFVMK